jgi:hypothetical protein
MTSIAFLAQALKLLCTWVYKAHTAMKNMESEGDDI